MPFCFSNGGGDPIEIFKLFGSIFVDNEGANKSIDDTGKKGEGLSGIFSKIGNAALNVGEVAAKGMVVAGTALAGISIKALQLGGELEQNLGGSEAVFNEFAETVQKKGSEAYKNMGLSASDFLATANKMGALFKGSGFEIEESAELSTKAMQRAADVASIMGLDVSAAMESVAGAAKGNFTMMDNLGVAMNDTSIQAYALSKGIDKATKDMSQQEKIGLAMEMFLEKTAYAAGNYAKENETLAGSIGTAKAALSNFLSGANDADALVEAFKNAATVIMKNLEEIVPRLAEGFSKIIQNLLPMIPALIAQLLPAAAGIIQSLVLAIADSLPDIIGAAGLIIQSLIEGIFGKSPELTIALDSVGEIFITSFGFIKDGAIVFWNFISQLAQETLGVLAEFWHKNGEKILMFLSEVWEEIQQALADVWGLIKQTAEDVFNALSEFWQKNGEEYLETAKNIWDAIWKAMKVVWDIISDTAKVVFDALKEFWEQNGKKIIETFSSVWQSIWNVVKPIWDNITSIAHVIFDALQFYWDTWGGNVLTNFKIVFDTVKDVFSGVLDAIQGLFKIFEGIFTGNWSVMWEGVKQVFSGVWDSIEAIFKGAINYIINGINGFINGINTMQIPDWIPGVGGMKINLDTIPLLAEGGNIEKSGWVVVGDAGPELLNLNAGAQVRPLDKGPDTESRSIVNNYYLQVKMDEVDEVYKLKDVFTDFSFSKTVYGGV